MVKKKVQVWIHRPNKKSGHEILLLLLKPERGGFWQPVTGGVDAGEDFDVAAMREAREETGMKFSEAVCSLDYGFEFERGDGKRFREQVYSLRAPETAPVRLDPHEHVDHRWVTLDEARAELPRLKHPSNAEGLRRLLARLAVGLIVTLFLGGLSRSALAAQHAIVSEPKGAVVHQLPNDSSPEVTTIPAKTAIKISSDLVRDRKRQYWYKIRVAAGQLGYVKAKDVKAKDIERELHAAGVQDVRTMSDPDAPSDNTQGITVRAMGMLGYDFAFEQVAGGGEIEAAYVIMPYVERTSRPEVAFGVAYDIFPNEQSLSGSLIYRFPTEWVADPEVRLRGGYGITSGTFVYGANVGVRYPFSLDSPPYFSGYLEAGALGSAAQGAAVNVFGTAGVGLRY
jgi:8-oxo-dGTP pyrophosphatase MutT (NUDIX family)